MAEVKIRARFVVQKVVVDTSLYDGQPRTSEVRVLLGDGPMLPGYLEVVPDRSERGRLKVTAQPAAEEPAEEPAA